MATKYPHAKKPVVSSIPLGMRTASEPTSCTSLARGAAKVYATARTPRTWDDERVVTLTLDVIDGQSIAAAVAAAVDITALINNAGANPPSASLLEVTEADIRANMEINIFGPVLLAGPSRRLWQPTRSRSSSTCTPSPAGTASAASTAPPRQHSGPPPTRCAWSSRPRGVHTTGVHMGYVETRMAAHADGPKMAPTHLVTKACNAVEANQYEVIGDELTAQVKAALSGPVGALYPGAPRDRDTPAAVEE